MAKNLVKSLYYITHRDNIASILQHGILSHALVEQNHIDFTPIYDTQIVSNRHSINTPDGQNLWDYANFYFQARNPMLYRVIKEKGTNNIVILGIKPDVLKHKNTFVSTGNAASAPSEILPADAGIKVIQQMWTILHNDWWSEEDGSKRKIMAECLVPKYVKPEMIHTIFVPSQEIHQIVQQEITQMRLTNRPEIVVDQAMFFQPVRHIRISKKLHLFEGDMFFSKQHTLTISVNTVGVMGKGLASRARYQFPDLYVIYQDWCKQKKIKMGVPAIYKREGSFDNELASDPVTLSNPNAMKWFLLFPTKNHWREKSDFAGIEAGLDWLVTHAEREGIQSLALPALGCGLGQLAWADVGPLMCRYLQKLPFNVAIYLPHEQTIPDEHLTAEFLLNS